MTAPKFPNIGQKGAPCTDKNCGHRECICILGLVASECVYCGRQIGYETGFYLIGEGKVVHANCHMTAFDSELSAFIRAANHRTNSI